MSPSSSTNMTAAVVNDSAAKGDGGGNPNETVEAAKAGDVTVKNGDKSFDKTAAAAEANRGDQAAKTASDHSEGANKSESDEASQIDVTKQAKVKVTTLAAVKSEEVDHHGGGVAGSSNAAGGFKNRSQYPSGSSYQQQQQQQSLQPQKLKAHYSQWPLPPHTYAAGRQHSAEDGASAGNGSGGSGDQSSSSTTKDGPSGTDVKNASGAGSGNNNKSSSNNNDDEDNEELLIKNDAKKKPQAIYSSNNAASSASSAPPPPSSSAVAGGAPGPWGSSTGHPHHPQQNPPHPLHPSHPHHPHHAQYQAHYQQWYRHYAHHHHHHQQQQRQHGQQGPPPHGQQPQQQHHAAHYHWHRQQQQQQHAHYPTQMKSSTTTTDTQQQQHHPPQSYHHHASTIYPTRSNDSSTNGTKRNVRELSTVDSREDTNTVRMKEENEEVSTTSCTMSLGDFSMTSLASSSPKGKRRKGTSRGRNSYDDDSLELSDKEIMNNLSMNSSYSSDMAAMLYGTSPTNSVVHRTSGTNNQDDDDLGKTPKKNNTSSKKPRPWDSSNAATNGMDDAVFRLDSMTPRFRSGTSDTDDGSSPALLDLIGGAETPTTGLLMSSIENAMMDDISLNRNLRGHAFTPLPHIMGGGAGGDAALGSGGDASGLSITPQLSWSTNNGSPLEITPRCFGLLDSTKSTNNHPLGSPKSFWKDNTSAASSEEKKSRRSSSGEKPSILSLLSPTMREMEISQDTSMDGSRSTTPLPLNYGKREQQKDVKKEQEHVNKQRADFNNQNTPVHNKHHPGHGPMMRGQHQQQPPMHHMQASPWAQLGGYMPSPVPGAFPSMSPGFGLYPQMEPNPNDRVRNLRGRGPPVHAIPPSHRLPPPTYHHFSPLTNVMKRPARPMAYHPPHGNVPPQVDVSSSSKSNCVPMKPPIPSKFQGDMNKYKDVAVPDFNNLVNFPCHMNQKSAPAPDGTRNCVMCGHSCPCTTGGKQKGKNNNSHPLADNNQNKGASGMNNNFAIIPSQNKGLCTLCDVNVWIVVHSHLEIKWCKGCKNFRPWAAFGEKGLATKCVRCRERQREKYAMEKEKKERAKIKPSSGRVMASN